MGDAPVISQPGYIATGGQNVSKNNSSSPFLNLPYSLLDKLDKLPLTARWVYLMLLKDVKLSRQRIPYYNSHIKNLSVSKIGDLCNISKGSAQTALTHLKTKGFIKIHDEVEGLNKRRDIRTKFIELTVF